jgi:hypothetical protein
MAPGNVNTRLATAKQILLKAQETDPPKNQDAATAKEPKTKHWREILLMLTGIDLRICPKCKKANLIRRPLAKGDSMLCYEPAPYAA